MYPESWRQVSTRHFLHYQLYLENQSLIPTYFSKLKAKRYIDNFEFIYIHHLLIIDIKILPDLKEAN